MKKIIHREMNLIDAVVDLDSKSSKNSARSWIKGGRVFVDGSIVLDPSFKILPGQELMLGQRKKYIADEIEILYEDKDLVIINKPCGLLSVSSNFEKDETAHSMLKSHYRKAVGVVHRLDQDTSGVMLFALNEKTKELLKKLFETHEIKRSYSAIVEGHVQPAEGTWQSYLYENANYQVKETNDTEKGRLAITHYQLLACRGRYSWLELKLETGRKNQIRVHCQTAGHPVAGDKKYGSKCNPLKRLCLHAHSLSFRHPISQKKLFIQSPLPEEFSRLFPTLGS